MKTTIKLAIFLAFTFNSYAFAHDRFLSRALAYLVVDEASQKILPSKLLVTAICSSEKATAREIENAQLLLESIRLTQVSPLKPLEDIQDENVNFAFVTLKTMISSSTPSLNLIKIAIRQFRSIYETYEFNNPNKKRLSDIWSIKIILHSSSTESLSLILKEAPDLIDDMAFQEGYGAHLLGSTKINMLIDHYQMEYYQEVRLSDLVKVINHQLSNSTKYYGFPVNRAMIEAFSKAILYSAISRKQQGTIAPQVEPQIVGLLKWAKNPQATICR